MRRNRHTFIIGAATLAATLLTSCVKDELHDTPHPDRGAVAVTADWSGRSGEAGIPQRHFLRIGGLEQEAGGGTSVFGQLLTPGKHTLAVYNRPEHIAVTGNTASVSATPQGGVAPMPGYLFASVQDISVPADDTLRVTAAMKQLVHRLDIELTATEGDYSRVRSATATLSGVASAVDIVTGERSAPAQTTGTFTQDGNRFTLFFRLVGTVAAEAQTLTVDITFDNGDTLRTASDLTGALKDFNSGVKPLMLTGNLLLPLEAGLTGATITDWNEAGSGNVEAN